MRIMVFDVPAEYGGALSILKQYYNDACADKDNEWIFVVSKPQLPDTDNVKVARLPWAKKSWFHRLWFDNVYALQLVRKFKPDKVISLQNTMVKADECFQELYVHQALPFCEKRFAFREHKKFWIYQNIISKMIFRSIKKCDSIIVQTSWMKEAVVQKTGISKDKITIIPPKVDIQSDCSYKQTDEKIFFYPANGAVYKNHKAIYSAVYDLISQGYKNFKVVLTLEKNEKNLEIEKKTGGIIEFAGYLPKERINEYYSKSVVLFPSYVETFGLPLLEARLSGCPIIASDCAFSKEILDGYDNARFFDPFDYAGLAEFMKKHL